MYGVRAIFILVLAMLTTACGVKSAWPTKEWKTSTPADQDVDPAELKALDDEFARSHHGYVNSFFVTRNGYLVYEKSYERNYDSMFSSAPD